MGSVLGWIDLDRDQTLPNFGTALENVSVSFRTVATLAASNTCQMATPSAVTERLTGPRVRCRS